jgi:hypothetical protein
LPRYQHLIHTNTETLARHRAITTEGQSAKQGKIPAGVSFCETNS